MAEWLRLQDGEAIQKTLPHDYAQRIAGGATDTFESRKDGVLISFSHYDVHAPQKQPGQVIVFIDKSRVCFLSACNQELDLARQACRQAGSDHQALCLFFQSLIQGDMEVQANFEARIIQAEDQVLKSSVSALIEEITRLRRTLFTMKKYYEQLGSILEGLAQNENGFISEADQREFQILNQRVQRLYENVHSLRDYVTQVREAYQSQIGIQQNHLMKTFTVVTAVFSPLSLLVGWYGMNLQMPEFAWTYGYLFVIGLAVLIVAVCYGIFKKHGWLK